MHPFGNEGPEVSAPFDKVRAEFMAAYPAEGDAKAKAEAKKKAFSRALKQARDKELICSREIGGIDYLWLVEKDGPRKNTTGGGGD